MKNNFNQIVGFILNRDNKELTNLLIQNNDRKIFNLHKGCILHVALISGNIEAAKILLKASIGKFDNL